MARGKSSGRYTPKRGGGEGGDDSSRWLGTYGDMITLLMAFFVMLYAISQVDQQKFEAFVQGLEGPFGNSAGMLFSGSSLAEMDAASDVGDQSGDLGIKLPDSFPTSAANPPTDQPTDPPSPASAEAPTPVPVATAVPADVLTVEAVREQLAEALGHLGLQVAVAEVRREERGIAISIAGDDVLFALGSTEINPMGRKVIAAIAAILEDYPNDIAVEGHTDDVPLRRAGYTNWNLSTDRAVAVLALLVERHGLEPERFGAMGYGEHRPLVPNDTKANRAKNRRVDIIIFTSGDTRNG